VRSPWIFSAVLETEKEWANLEVAEQLALKGIETRPVFWPLGRMKAFSDYKTVSDNISQRIAERAISLPSGPHVSDETAKEIAKVIESVIN
jgi:perosamine synthetase